MDFASNDNHSDIVWSSLSGIIYLRMMQTRTMKMRTMTRCKYNAVMGMITPGDDDMMANLNAAKSCPYLLRALGEDGFDPMNPSVKRSMCGLMTEFNELLSTEYHLDINGISNNKISYDRVPRIQSDCSFLDSKEWVNTAIHIAGWGMQHRR